MSPFEKSLRSSIEIRQKIIDDFLEGVREMEALYEAEGDPQALEYANLYRRLATDSILSLEEALDQGMIDLHA
jgi:hypothetical protein